MQLNPIKCSRDSSSTTASDRQRTGHRTDRVKKKKKRTKQTKTTVLVCWGSRISAKDASRALTNSSTSPKRHWTRAGDIWVSEGRRALNNLISIKENSSHPPRWHTEETEQLILLHSHSSSRVYREHFWKVQPFTISTCALESVSSHLACTCSFVSSSKKSLPWFDFVNRKDCPLEKYRNDFSPDATDILPDSNANDKYRIQPFSEKNHMTYFNFVKRCL